MDSIISKSIPNELTPINSKIIFLRNTYVMLDRDLADLYNVETKRINEQVKRNKERFPEDFCFRLTESEKNELVANCDRLNALKHSTSTPFAFTEQGVAMLSAVLRSETAIKTSIQIINAFVAMRRFMQNNVQLFSELDFIKRHQIEHDKQINELFSMMDKYKIENKQGIFFKGQIFDAYNFFEKIIQKANKEIILIDSYTDLSVLEYFTRKNKNVKLIIYTKDKTNIRNPITNLDVKKFNSQYPFLELKYTNTMHDRFLIIDGKEVYHLGASLKDLGKQCFAFSLLENSDIIISAIINNL